jgi:hypothetical protein
MSVDSGIVFPMGISKQSLDSGSWKQTQAVVQPSGITGIW